jgi:hypothetical protein
VERPGLASERFRLPFAATVSAGRPVFPAEVLPAELAPSVFPAEVFPAELALFALPAPDTVAALRGLAAGNGNSAFESPAAAPLAGDIYPLNTAAGRQATGQGQVQRCGSICPNRFYAVPNYCPSDHPNVAAHQTAIRRSMQGAGGSSAQGFAERITAQPQDLQATRVRCTRCSRTSYHPGRPSTYRRKKTSSLAVGARSRPGNLARRRMPGMPAD